MQEFKDDYNKYFTRSDPENLRLTIHKVKSTIKNLGLKQLSDLVQEGRRLIMENMIPHRDEHIQAFNHAVSKIIDSLQQKVKELT